ncbi:MAG: DNA-packaging protein [Bacteroides sp.]|nr:DNA-packaging protein [Bacteroides sp.]
MKQQQKKNPPGRPKKFKNAKQFERQVSELIRKLRAEGAAITPEAIAAYLDVDIKTLWNYGHAEGYEEFFPVARRLMREVQADFIDKSLSGKYKSSVAIFLMKNNFGYTDRQEVVVTGFDIEF